jgi:hypothetical protein
MAQTPEARCGITAIALLRRSMIYAQPAFISSLPPNSNAESSFSSFIRHRPFITSSAFQEWKLDGAVRQEKSYICGIQTTFFRTPLQLTIVRAHPISVIGDWCHFITNLDMSIRYLLSNVVCSKMSIIV